MIGFHQLETLPKVYIDPARNVMQTFRSESTVGLEPSIHRDRILSSETFDYHVEQSTNLQNATCDYPAFRILERPKANTFFLDLLETVRLRLYSQPICCRISFRS
jgi:hypothetical protein